MERYLFVKDDDVAALVAKVAWLAALYQPADGLFGASSGVLRYRILDTLPLNYPLQ